MKIKMTIEVELESWLIDYNDLEERKWLTEEVLNGDRSLIIHSNEIGDYIGEVTEIESIKWVENETSH